MLSGVMAVPAGPIPLSSLAPKTLAAANAAAGHQHEHRPRPVVATAALVDLRRAAELAGHDHDGRVEQAALGEGGQQRRTAPGPTRGSARSLQVVKMFWCMSHFWLLTVAKRTPDCDQPAGQQAALTKRRGCRTARRCRSARPRCRTLREPASS